MKVIVPVAGLGSRLKPHTFTTPKPLMQVAGRAIIDYVIEDVKKLNPTEIIFVVGYKRGQVKEFVRENYPNLNCSFVEQKIRNGDGSAVRLALEKITKDEEIYIVFGADTLIDFDLKKEITENKNNDAIIFGMRVDEPQHYGIMNVREDFQIYEVEEKPKIPKSNLAIIGAYYFKSAIRVKNYLNYFYDEKITVKDEYKIVQVIEKYIEDEKLLIKAINVKKWFDCGRPSILLDANKYFLEKFSSGKIATKGTSIIIPPSYVHKNVTLENCVIGPYASIGEGCNLKDVAIKRSILNPGSIVKNMVLSDSLIGKDVILKDKAKKLNIGDKSEIYME